MQDLRLAPMLDTLRASDRQVFLATNSLWDYTHIVMVHPTPLVILVEMRYAEHVVDWSFAQLCM